MDINSIYQALLNYQPNEADTAYWAKRQEQGVSPENVQSSLSSVNAAYNQLLGRDMQPGVMQYLDPQLQQQGMQAVRSHIAGSDEYLNRMLNNPGQTEVPAWQQAARQGTMHQSMMPGTFWDYSNPLLSDPASAKDIMSPPGSLSTQLMAQFTDPENSSWLKELLGVEDEEDGKGDKKKSATSGGGQASYPSQSHGYTLSDDQQALIGTSFIDRSREKHAQALRDRFGQRHAKS